MKKQLNEQQQNKHAEESSKIEIRNLQNALDSAKKEVEAQQANVNEFKMQIEDLKKQLFESQQLTKSNSTSGDTFLVSVEFLISLISKFRIYQLELNFGHISY